eukprot:scaffold206613_cov26-Tisochrysis_lutea.AAC.1
MAREGSRHNAVVLDEHSPESKFGSEDGRLRDDGRIEDRAELRVMFRAGGWEEALPKVEAEVGTQKLADPVEMAAVGRL